MKVAITSRTPNWAPFTVDGREIAMHGLLLAAQWYFPSAGMAAVTGGEEVVLVKEILCLYNTDVAAACNETWGVPSCLSGPASDK